LNFAYDLQRPYEDQKVSKMARINITGHFPIFEISTLHYKDENENSYKVRIVFSRSVTKSLRGYFGSKY
jgi:hypothetical protein